MRLLALAALVVLAAPLASAQNPSARATYDTITLREGFTPDPWTRDLTAGGATRVRVGSGCDYGTVANAPDVKMTYNTSGRSTLYIYATSGSDTTILVNTANGRWVCNDDGLGNANPVVVIPNAGSGRYDIWVGTYGSDTAPATLYISEIDPR